MKLKIVLKGALLPSNEVVLIFSNDQIIIPFKNNSRFTFEKVYRALLDRIEFTSGTMAGKQEIQLTLHPQVEELTFRVMIVGGNKQPALEFCSLDKEGKWQFIKIN